jgi:hypothetical protein
MIQPLPHQEKQLKILGVSNTERLKSAAGGDLAGAGH